MRTLMSYEHDYGTVRTHKQGRGVGNDKRIKTYSSHASLVCGMGDKTRRVERALARKEHATKIEKGKKTAERLGGDEEGSEEKKK